MPPYPHLEGWRRCRVCLKLQVSFRKRATNLKALLRNMTYTDKASYGSLPPCNIVHGDSCTNKRVIWKPDFRDPFICVTWLIHTWRDSFICVTRENHIIMTYASVTWLIHLWHDSFICDMTHSNVTWLIHMWHDAFIRVIYTWHERNIRVISSSTATHLWHDLFIRDMSHSYVTLLMHTWHDSFIHVTWKKHTRHTIIHINLHVTWLIHTWHGSFVRDMTHTCTFDWCMNDSFMHVRNIRVLP